MLPLVGHTGHANLSPVKLKVWQLSRVRTKNDGRDCSSFFKELLQIIRYCEYNSGNLISHLQIPLLISRPHLVEYPILAFGRVKLGRTPFLHRTKHMILESDDRWALSAELLHAFEGQILSPQKCTCFFSLVPLLIWLIALYQGFTKPVCYAWETNLVVQRAFVLEWLSISITAIQRRS